MLSEEQLGASRRPYRCRCAGTTGPHVCVDVDRLLNELSSLTPNKNGEGGHSTPEEAHVENKLFQFLHMFLLLVTSA